MFGDGTKSHFEYTLQSVQISAANTKRSNTDSHTHTHTHTHTQHHQHHPINLLRNNRRFLITTAQRTSHGTTRMVIIGR